MNLFRSLIVLSSVLAFAATPSAAQSSDNGTSTSSNASGSSSSFSSSTTSPPSSSFGNLTTTNSLGSTFVTSIPITIPLNTTPTTTSSAPFPSLTGYPACVVNCLTFAVARTNCTSITDVACYCPNPIFPNALYSCVAGNCSTNVPSAENLARQFCAVDNVTLSFSITAAPSTATSPSSASSPTSTSSQSSSKSNAASALYWTPDTLGWTTTMVVAACSALFGAALL
ncbi:hypothetical protein EI94DRAFT_1723397 [Lactarius quietus]|nr:hypothetical protein EI94DRAFT_1723397 [Lactarius quietus]